MKKWYLSVILFLNVFLLAGISYSQDLTEWEFEVYHDYLARCFYEPEWTKENLHGIDKSVARRYGIILDKLNDIMDRSYEPMPSGWEWKVGDELFDKLSVSENFNSFEDIQREFDRIAGKYGNSRN